MTNGHDDGGREIVVTGASGFLGEQIVAGAKRRSSITSVIPIQAPRRNGIDLAQSDAPDELLRRIQLVSPEKAILIHAAAVIDWASPEAVVANAAMGAHLSVWAREVGIGFAVLISTVNVYPRQSFVDAETPCRPQSFYGIGKHTAEQVWQQVFGTERGAILRLAGVWGWQQNPTLFYNRLLLAAAFGSSDDNRPVIQNGRVSRNYISAREASECALHIGANGLGGVFLGAGREAIELRHFVSALSDLPGSKLNVVWRSEDVEDVQYFHPSEELLPCLSSFDSELQRVWSRKPEWVTSDQ